MNNINNNPSKFDESVFEQLEEETWAEGKPVNATYFCPNCRTPMLWIHDLRCAVCNNRNINWCPTCELHFKIKNQLTIME